LLGEAVQVETREPSSGVSKEALAKNANEYGRLPISFETNRGQTDKKVKFLARGQGYGLFLTSTGAVLSLNKGAEPRENSESSKTHDGAVLSLSLIGAAASSQITADNKLTGKVNYFVGNDQSKWRRNVPTYAKVRYTNVYHGIDLVYHGNQQQLEYDFVVAPKANPRAIRMRFAGAEKMSICAEGDLVLSTPSGDVVQRKPIAYQEVNGERKEVSANYRLEGDTISFDLGSYDQNQSLTIDPVLSYSTYMGGAAVDLGLGIAVDSQGSAYLTGNATSADFPVAGAFQSVFGGAADAFVQKLNPAGSAFVYSTFLGGSGTDVGNAIAIDAQGNAYVTGTTGSGNFPITLGSVQTSKDGFVDAFVTKFDPSGSALTYSTFLGGNNNDTPNGIAVATDGRVHVVGRTESTRFAFGIPVPRHGNPVYKSRDKAETWSGSSNELTSTRVNAFAQDPINPNILYAGSNLGVYKSLNSGANWNPTGIANQSTAPLFTNVIAIDPSNTDIIYAGTTAGVFKSTNGGSLYGTKNSGFVSLNINAIAIDPVTPTTLYAGSNSSIYKSTNGGDTWVEMRSGITGSAPRVNEIVFDPTNSATVYIGTVRGMFKSTNGATSWTEINGGALSSSPPQITALVINPTNPLILYAAGANGHMYKTVDGGTNWTESGVGLPPVIPVTTMAIDPVTPSILYAGGAQLFKSSDSGGVWLQHSAGLDNFTITGVAVDASNPAIVYAGTEISGEAFALRLNPSGSTLDYFLPFGGNEIDDARGVALDDSGSPYVVGITQSPNFPTVNAFQPIIGGESDAFVAKLDSNGTGFVYSTYLGGSAGDTGRAVAVRQGEAYVVGSTSSNDYPLVNPLRTTLEAFEVDAFVTRFNATGSALLSSTYLGGQFQSDQALAVAVNTNGAIYVTGSTNSEFDFPLQFATQVDLGGNSGSNDAFVTKLHSSGAGYLYSTFLGGAATDQGNGIALDPSGNPYVIGTTSSFDFPTVNPLKPNLNVMDAFITKFNANSDLALLNTALRDPVMVGNNLTYKLTAVNLGVDPISNIVLTDTLPAGVNFVSAMSSQGSCSGTTTVTCNLGNLAQDGSAFVQIVVTPQAVATITNMASVTSSAPDPAPANNSASQSTHVSALPSITGRVTHPSGLAAIGESYVDINVTGSATTSRGTFQDGNYQISNLPLGGTYTVAPAREGFVFHPQNRTLSNLTADATADFDSVRCTFQLTSTDQNFAGGGGSGSVTLTAPDSLCPWTATSDVPWITVTSGSAGVGSGAVSFSVSPTLNARTGTLRIAGKIFTVSQQAPLLLKLTSGLYSAGESGARVQLDVIRSGNSSTAVAVNYATSDTAGLTNCSVVNGVASSRCDYATAVGTLNFAAGETIKTISIPIVDDAYAEGSESFTITLSNASGAPLGTPATATVTITDNETSNGTNPVDQTPFFVRQQYVDFLGREPDPGGFAAWQNVINNCPTGDTTCDRIHVSSSFFRSPEFQGRGYFVYRFYPTAFGRKPDYVEFIPDLAKVSGFLSDAELESAKLAFIAEFMSRPAFMTKYDGLNNTQYVDTLLSTAGITHVARDFWIAALGNGTRTRAQVLREIAESTQVYDKYYNQAFVVMQYFGYLRRDPDALYVNWIAVLDANPSDYRGMVNGFMNSLEYRFRFGP
jgi:uncharacterized repeat protein (TIGR01451 family)